jgi:hypothetical protein
MYEIEEHFESVDAQFSAIKEYVEQSAGKVELHVAEQVIFNKLLQLGLCFIKEYVRNSCPFHDPQAPPVAKDGSVPAYKGTSTRSYFSIFGEFKIERARYLTASGRYWQPLDHRLNLPTEKYSYLLQKWLQTGCTETNYHEAANHFNEIFGFSFRPNALRRITDQVSDEVAPFYDENAAPSRESEGPCIGISADGKGVRIIKSDRDKLDKFTASESEAQKPRLGRGEKNGKKKEAVVTADFSFFPQAREPEEIVKALLKKFTHEEREQEKRARQLRRENNEPEPRAALNKHLRAFFDGKAKAADYLMQRIQKRDPDQQKPVVVLVDGAPSLEKNLNKALDEYGITDRVAAFLLDIIHVTEYLWKAGTALHGEQGSKRVEWVETKLRALLKSDVDTVIKGLKISISKNEKLSRSKREKIQTVITYFENHRHMMDYKAALEKGYPIATGLVESACCSLVKDRMEQSGMRWSIEGAKSILELRAVKKNNDWELFWKTFIRSQAQKCYPDNYRCQHIQNQYAKAA